MDRSIRHPTRTPVPPGVELLRAAGWAVALGVFACAGSGSRNTQDMGNLSDPAQNGGREGGGRGGAGGSPGADADTVSGPIGGKTGAPMADAAGGDLAGSDVGGPGPGAAPDVPPPAPSEPLTAASLRARIGQAPVDGGFALPDYWVWGSSVVKGDDGLYHMFVSRWTKRLPFHPGWMLASEIAHATSPTPEGPYTFRDVALPPRGAQYWDGRSTHNPKIVRYKDQYILFYMGSTHPYDVDSLDVGALGPNSTWARLARSNKRVGVAVAPSPFGPWTRPDRPSLNTKDDTFYSFLTSNPTPWIEADGSTWLAFKARAKQAADPFYTGMTIGVARAPHFTGPYTVVGDEPIFGRDRSQEVEDPFIWKDAAGFHMLAKDQRGGVSGQQHAGVMAHSPDGTKWTFDKPALAYTKTIHWSDGRQQVMGQLERVFGLLQNGTLTHLFFAGMDGPGGFANGTKTWNLVVRINPTP